MNDFMPKGYEIPSTSNYYKFEEGENRFRILAGFGDGSIMGTEYWITVGDQRKPQRVPMGKSVVMGDLQVDPRTGELDMPKHFWAMPVWDYKEKRVKLLEITQKTIMRAITALASNNKWGTPLEYDLVVVKTKEGGKTNYTVTPDPKEKFSAELYGQYMAMGIKIERLFTGEDPFMSDNKGNDLADDFEKEMNEAKAK